MIRLSSGGIYSKSLVNPFERCFTSGTGNVDVTIVNSTISEDSETAGGVKAGFATMADSNVSDTSADMSGDGLTVQFGIADVNFWAILLRNTGSHIFRNTEKGHGGSITPHNMTLANSTSSTAMTFVQKEDRVATFFRFHRGRSNRKAQVS